MDAVMPYLLALLPTIGVGALFYFIMKAIIEADRRERVAQASWRSEHEAAPEEPSAASTRIAQTSTSREDREPTRIDREPLV